ncbi:MAG: NrfD/PsrC family molybdoenzyme membrane anchor subunit [Candidatus Chlorobium antarcticum]|jgi:molybdopterin-containing oxidoreductase family membrane subunit|nr:NrfD/PsrC family molybdoenzyme membrane anchor subunit [Candidatus Chlorobium antarcticum]
MIEQALTGHRNYWIWSLALLAMVAGAFYASALQSADGFVHTGMGNNAIWGLYHAQLPFLASIAAASLAVLVPGTLQKYSFLARLAPLAAFLGATASAMSLLFIAADLGMQRRFLTLLLNPSPGAPASWQVPLLLLFLALTLAVGWAQVGAVQKGVKQPAWIRSAVMIAIPAGLALPVISAFMLAVVPGSELWTSPLLAPRLMASGVAAGAGIMLVMAVAAEQLAGFKAGEEALERLAAVAAWAGLGSLVLTGIEAGTVVLGNVTAQTSALGLLYGNSPFASASLFSLLAGAAAIGLLLVPSLRRSSIAAASLGALLAFSVWLQSGLTLILAGQVREGLATVDYAPALPEILLTSGVWAGAVLLITVLLKITASAQLEREGL